MAKSSALTVEFLRPGDPLDEWDGFVERSPQGSLFCRSWWLRAVCPQGFEILALRRGGQLVAGMPIARYRKWGFEAIHMPQLTQTLGVLLAPPAGASYEKRLSAEMELLSALVAAIPRVAHFTTFCHHTFTNWLPFYWAGYQQTTRYTYVIEDLTNLEAVFSSFAHSKRKNIKKAEGQVTVREDFPPDDFYRHHEMTLRKQGETLSYSRELFGRIHDASYERQAGKTWFATDPAGTVHAAIFVIFDPRSAYYLLSTIDPDYRDSGASTLLVRDAIAYAARHSRCFDFEGSMIEGVEHSFRKFGAVQRAYFHISRNRLPFWVRAGLALRDEVGKCMGRLRRKKPAATAPPEDAPAPTPRAEGQAPEAPQELRNYLKTHVGCVAGVSGPDARRGDAGDANGGHRRGAATQQTARCRRNPTGRRDFWPLAASLVVHDALRCIASSSLLARGQNRRRRSPRGF